ncbi:ankyrin repeat protein [Aureobasidium sp. EXF-10728]|nr:ankyrin repeat protein [Aureobasidium sp. EXF-10728]
MDKKKLKHDDYTVAWICPLEVEQIAALEMLDEEHRKLPQPENDHNTYNLGTIFNHNVVIAGLPTAGNCSAATVVAQMRNTYPRLRFGLLVGIGGGVPTKTDDGPIRLGHIVVSKPVGQHSGALQYDHGKAEANQFVRTGSLASPPTVLLNAARELQVSRRRLSVDPLAAHLQRIDTTKRGLRSFRRPPADQDQLYQPDYIHLDRDKSCKKCKCDASKLVNRSLDDSDDDSDKDSADEEDDDWLIVHRGTIASGETVMRDGAQRDALAQSDKILCFEMEAAGALNDFPCLVIRGISDYSDSHKNDKWHGYAAAVAAAYARELFQHMPVDEVRQCRVAEADLEEMVENTRNFAKFSVNSRVKDWLGPSDASINFVNASKLCHPNTGLWLLKSDRYKWFKITPGARLWLRGIPGSGKTVLTSTIIKDLMSDDRPTGTAIIYFFFSFSDASKQKLEHMLRSLIFQLVGWNDAAKNHLMELFERSRQGREQPRTTELVEVFNQMVREFQDVSVVLDALDESKDRNELLDWVNSSSDQACRFVLTSRSERDIEDSFASWLSPDHIITLEDEPMGEDIEAYVYHRLEEEKNLRRWKSMHDDISSTLIDKAAGMFRWVYCQLQELSTCMDKPAVRRMLQTLPADLYETYDRILQNIPASRVSNAIKLLQLLAFSGRPLRLVELVDAVATEPDMELPFDAENRVSPPDAIIGLGKDPNAQGGRYGNALQAATISGNLKTVQVLLDYGAEVNGIGGQFGSALYAAASIGHVDILRLLLSYGADLGALEWVDGERDNIPPALQIAAESGHAEVVKTLLMHGADVNARNMYCRDNSGRSGHYTALEAASSRGHTEVVKVLLENNAEVDARKPYGARRGNLDERFVYGTPLQAASIMGHLDVVRMLVKSGADVNLENGSKGYVLHAALSKAHTEVALFLVESGADIEALGSMSQTTLHAAASGGDLTILRLLIEKGLNVDQANDNGETPLMSACERGSTQIVELLLHNGADVKARDEQGSTALYVACTTGNIEIVQMLLDKDADVNARGGPYGTPLCTASRSGGVEVVQILLDKGADINAEEGPYGPALYVACEGGNMEIVQILLGKGADVNACRGPYGTPLCTASYNGNIEVMQMLLDNGADVNIEAGEYSNALLSACYSSDVYIDPKPLRLLLDNGAEINAQGGECGTALCAACEHGNIEVVEMLLRGGADVHAPGGKYGSALCAAVERGSIKVVQILLNNGAIPRPPRNSYWATLDWNFRPDNDKIAELLFNAGAAEQLATTQSWLRRSASVSGMLTLTETQSERERDESIKAPRTRRHSLDAHRPAALDDAFERGVKNMADWLSEGGAPEQLATTDIRLKRSASISGMFSSVEQQFEKRRKKTTDAVLIDNQETPF